MKYTLIVLTSLFLFSCNQPFINHSLEYEKIGDCTDVLGSVKMVANINGIRYEFNSCLNDGFDGENYTVERQGDSIVVDFPKVEADKKALYKLILDVDAKPGYQHIILDGREVMVNVYER